MISSVLKKWTWKSVFSQYLKKEKTFSWWLGVSFLALKVTDGEADEIDTSFEFEIWRDAEELVREPKLEDSARIPGLDS